MKLNQIRHLLAVAERGSIRGAAHKLGVTQPAISRSIRDLEHELGVTLFEREANGVVATMLGVHFIQIAKTAQNELDRACDELNQMTGQPIGHIAVCLSTDVHIAHPPTTISSFIKKYSKVKIDITENLFPEAEPELNNGTLDLYVGPLPEIAPSRKFTVETVDENERAIFLRKGHPLFKVKSLSELVNAEWISTSNTINSEIEIEMMFVVNKLPKPKIVAKTHSALSTTTMVANTDLLAILPTQAVNLPWNGHKIERIYINENIPSPPICVIYRSDFPLTPAAKYFCQMIRQANAEATSAQQT